MPIADILAPTLFKGQVITDSAHEQCW